jgi:hypothetical protein
VPPDDHDPRRPRLPDNLTFPQARLNRTLGTCLAQSDRCLLEAPLPEKLQSLINQLDGIFVARAPAPGHDNEDEQSAAGAKPRS